MAKKDDLPSASEARNELQRMLRLFKAFEHADKTLAVLESAEQILSERTKAADEAAERMRAARGELLAAEEAREAVKREAVDLNAKAKNAANDVIAKANAQATAIVEQATADANKARAELATLLGEVADTKERLRDAQGALEAARDTIAKAERLRQAMAGV
jgi:hypothetical protein